MKTSSAYMCRTGHPRTTLSLLHTRTVTEHTSSHHLRTHLASTLQKAPSRVPSTLIDTSNDAWHSPAMHPAAHAACSHSHSPSDDDGHTQLTPEFPYGLNPLHTARPITGPVRQQMHRPSPPERSRTTTRRSMCTLPGISMHISTCTRTWRRDRSFKSFWRCGCTNTHHPRPHRHAHPRAPTLTPAMSSRRCVARCSSAGACCCPTDGTPRGQGRCDETRGPVRQPLATR